MTQLSPPTEPAAPPPPDAPRWSRKRKIVTTIVAIVSVLLLTAAGVAYWALDRFVIDHVEISDVAAFEAQVAPTTIGVATTQAPVATDPVAATIADTLADTGEITVTESSYSSDSMAITISTVVEGTGSATVTYYVADVVVDDATQLRGGFADNKFGANIVADTSEIAEYYNAVFAINGDYYGFRDSGIVIRNGVLFRDDGVRQGLAIYSDGSMQIYDEKTITGDELLAAGVWNTLSFGPALVDDGAVIEGIDQIEIDTNIGNHSVQGSHPRTGLGVIDNNHFVFIVVDGRSKGYSKGVTLPEFAEIFRDLGATEAYNLDGGGSATMYFNGELVNNPLGKNRERGTSDILYFAEAAA